MESTSASEGIRVGIIGVGWGSVVQVPAFRMVPPFEVVALCSRRAERVEAAGEALDIADTSTDWAEFVQRDDLDLISVCTPVGLHAQQTLAAIAAGKHVMVEKPVGVDATQTEAMLDAAEAAGVQHAVCFESRWEPARLAVWDRVRAGHLGEPYLATARSAGDFWHPTRAIQSEWMYTRAEGGGYLMGMAAHDIDYVCALFGDPVAVCADVRTFVPERTRPDGSTLHVDADDTAALLLRMADGMLAVITSTAVALHENRRSFECFGSRGSLTMAGALLGTEEPEIRSGVVESSEGEVIAPSDRMPASGAALPKRRAAGAIRALALMLEDWVPAFAGQASPVPTLRDGHRVQRVVDAALRSSTGEGWVAL